MKVQLIALTALTAFSAAAVDSSSLRLEFSGSKPGRGAALVLPTGLDSEARGRRG